MKRAWVDFAAVKQSVTMSMVLGHYRVNWLQKKDHELRGRCPIHKGEGADAFHVNVEKNCFQCFSCKARGNVLDFVAAMESCTVRDAGLKIQEWFSVLDGIGEIVKTNSQAPPKNETVEKRGEETAAENKPLTFQLTGVDPAHSYLRERGLNIETAEQFGLGFFAGKGSMSGRLVIPIHNERGELVAYAGRTVGPKADPPKYKFPAGFHKSLELYNLHRVLQCREAKPGSPSTVILVEGFFDCIKVHELDFPGVALMGSSMSEQQEKLLRDHFSGAVLLFDGDEAGRLATTDCLTRLGRGMWVKAVVLPEGKQPDDFTSGELAGFLNSGSA